MLSRRTARSLSLGALAALVFTLGSLPAPAQAQSPCIQAAQNRIAWDYNGNKRWGQVNLQRLCQGVNSDQPARCFKKVMHGNVSWGGGTQWKWENAIDLCERSQNARATISCFKQAVRSGQPWKDAIAKCDERRAPPPPPPPAPPVITPRPPPLQAPPVRQQGGVFTLRSHHSKYVVAEGDGRARANRDGAAEWERWTLIPNSNGTVSFKSHHGKYLVAESDGRAMANRDVIGPWEQWQMVRHGNGTVSFKSHHGKYLVAEANGELNANRAQIGPWERFKMRPAGAGAPPKLDVTFEVNVDRPGSDYKGINVAADPRGCANRCAVDPRCKAYTYVKPGVQGPSARCYLKDPAPAARPNNCCTSGLKGGGATPPPTPGVRVKWSRKPGAAKDIGIGRDRRPWVIGTDRQGGGYGIYRWKGNNWEKMPGAAVRIDVGPNGQAWVVNDSQQIYRWKGNNWEQMPGRAHDIGIGANGAVWVIGTDRQVGGYGIYRWQGRRWKKMPGAGVRIDVGPAGNAWVVNDKQGIYRWQGRRWKQLPGLAYDIGVGAKGAVWVIGTNKVGGGYSPYRLNKGKWQKGNGGLTNISVGRRGAPLGTNENDGIFFGRL